MFLSSSGSKASSFRKRSNKFGHRLPVNPAFPHLFSSSVSYSENASAEPRREPKDPDRELVQQQRTQTDGS
ncbi:hypothetical protein ATANTOWER_022961 [Ataeniobius toweri]|uniref:Uncharacterized protein n=1 Tax=Ataeniobius toweri TaxID=208326 RepID=A0ABU7C3C6_9TELE|nr:hypothetical protein [Ataeniobius toweri]